MLDRARFFLCTAAGISALTLVSATFGQGCGMGGDCCVANPGTTGCIDVTCCTAVCTADAYCCDTEWDNVCATAAATLCPACAGGGTGCGFGGDCCTANPGTMGCLDVVCCEAICAADAYCCATEWDAVCAAAAGSTCAACIVPCTPPGSSSAEVELCGEDLNGGCNSGGAGTTEPCAVGSVISGTFWADANVRDTDWYLLNVDASTEVTLNLYNSGSAFAAIVDSACGGIVGAASSGSCPSTTSVCLIAGQYFVVALPSVFNGLPCGTGAVNDYVLEITGIPCSAEPPVNDSCPAASIALEGYTPFTNIYAMTDWGVVSCGFGGAPFLNEVFFTFTATQSGDYQIETCTGSVPFDTGIEVYSACPEVGGAQLACNDDGTGCPAFSSDVYFTATAGTTYTILMGGWNGATGTTEMNIVYVGDAPSCGDASMGDCCVAGSGPFCSDLECCTTVCGLDAFCCNTMWDQICAQQAAGLCSVCGGSGEPPVNDECSAAIPAVLGANNINNALANDSYPVSTCGFGGQPFLKDVFFTFTPAVTGAYTLETCSGSAPFDTGIDVWDGCPDLGASMIACNDDGTGCTAFSSFLIADLVAGVPYVIRVGGWNGAFGATEMFITEGAPQGPANDDCTNATPAFVGSTPFNTTGSTTDGPNPTDPSCGTFGAGFWNDVWFSFTAPATGTFHVSLCGAGWDTRIDVYYLLAGCYGALLHCNDDSCGLQSEVDIVATSGVHYLIRIGGYGAANVGSGNMVITAAGGGGGGGAGLTCAAPIVMVMGDNAFTRAGCTVDLAYGGYCDMGPFGTDTNWNCQFRTFTATSSGTHVFSTCNLATHDTRLSIQATCDFTTVLACNDDGAGCASFTSIMTADLLCDTTYIVAIGGYTASTPLGAGTINVSTTGTPCSTPCPGDFDLSGSIDGADLAFMLGGWGTPVADMDGSGSTDGGDLSMLLGVFGTPCP